MARLPSLAAMARGAARDHRVVAGVLDAGMSSLATFIVGFHATRSLDPQALGGYALAFSVFVFSGFVPAQLIFTPTEIAAVSYPRGRQLLLLRESLLRGSFVSLAAAVATSPWFLVAPAAVPGDALIAFVVTCAAATFVSPIQDHFRRMLHVAHASWRAVIVAIVQIATVLVGVVVGPRLGVPPAWLPFGALAAANVVSLSLGLLMSARELSAADGSETLERAWVLKSGRPLLAVGLIPSATTFIVSWIVSALAGAATLGFVEAARIVSQPVAVLQVGLGNVLGPRATRAASLRDRVAGRAVNLRFRVLVVGAGVAWLALVAVPAPWNPLPFVLPTAYVVPGLVAASVAAFTIQSLSQGQRFELYGASRERQVAQAEAEGNAVRILCAFAAGPLGAFVVPLGNTALGLIRLGRSHRWLTAHYAGVTPMAPAPHPRPGSSASEPRTSPPDA